MKVIQTISNVVQRIGEVLLVLVACVLVIITFYGVFMRKAFNDPPTWQYELSIVLFSWLTFIGAALAFKRHEHIKLDFIESRLQGVSRKILEILIQLFVLVFLVIGLFGGMQVVGQTIAQKYTTIGIPVATFYSAFAVCMVMSFVFTAERIMKLAAANPGEFKRSV